MTNAFYGFNKKKDVKFITLRRGLQGMTTEKSKIRPVMCLVVWTTKHIAGNKTGHKRKT